MIKGICNLNTSFNLTTHYYRIFIPYILSEDVNKIIIDYNCWYEISGWIALLEDRFFNYATDWETYRSASGQDVHSIAADPLLNTDYTLQDNSPCINAGLTISTVTNDYNGEQRPIGSKYDIGAFESNVITSIENNLITSEACIHPNPVNNTLTFVTEAEQIPGKLIIYNSNGQEIITKQIDQVKTEIDLSNLVSGLYFVKFNGVIITETNKIIIM